MACFTFQWLNKSAREGIIHQMRHNVMCLSPEETAHLILTLFRQHQREARFVGPLLGIDPDVSEPVLRARLEAFFRGVRFRPAE